MFKPVSIIDLLMLIVTVKVYSIELHQYTILPVAILVEPPHYYASR